MLLDKDSTWHDGEQSLKDLVRLSTWSLAVTVRYAIMAELASQLVRMIVRAFYHTEHILVIDALCYHSTLSDYELGLVVGMNVKPVRKVVGRLKEDGLVSVQTRLERRTDGSSGYFGGAAGSQGKERLTHRDWYYINFHRAIDAVKYRMWKLSKHIESLGASTTEKKDYSCPQCGNQYGVMEVLDNVKPETGDFMCHRCGHTLDRIPDDERSSENEHMKKFNQNFEPFLNLMRQIDGTSVPENDFETALSKHIPARRDDEINPAPRTETVDAPNRNIASTKGLEIKQETIAVKLQDDETVKQESQAEEARRRREKEARQNALPEWISKSTVTGEITTVGAKEEKLRREREAHTAPVKEDSEDRKAANTADEDVMNQYYAELERINAEEAAKAAQSDEEEQDDDDDDDEDDDEFEDVDVTGAGTPAVNGKSGGVGTPFDSSVATDDEREAKRARLDDDPSFISDNGRSNPTNSTALMSGANGAQSDEDDDLEFENV